MRAYLDHAAATPVRPEVVDAMLPFLRDGFGNPSSVHRRGREARAALEKARGTVADALGVPPRALVFTASGTEANNVAIRGAALRAGSGVLLATGAEHPSVVRTVEDLAARGFEAAFAGLEPLGAPRLGALKEAAAGGRVVLAAFSLVNSETGAILPAEEVARALRPRGVPMLLDAAQALGKLPAEAVASAPVDFVAVSAHKIGGPKGIGALAAKTGRALAPILSGGGQEFGLRPGTENVAAAVGFARAAELALAEQPAAYARAEALRLRLLAGVTDLAPGAALHGDPGSCSPFIVNLGFPDAESEALVQALDLEGAEVSAGTACSSGKVEPSRVLALMGSPLAGGAVRVSFGARSAEADVDAFLAALRRVLARMKG